VVIIVTYPNTYIDNLSNYEYNKVNNTLLLYSSATISFLNYMQLLGQLKSQYMTHK
jgi:hypothetical protein